MSDVTALTLAVAFAAGAFSFASPCVLALVPGFLSFVSGATFGELGARRGRVTGATLAFILGFSVIFTHLGAGAGLIGLSLARYGETLNLLGGVLLVSFGVGMVLLPRMGVLQGEHRPLPFRRPTSMIGATLVGAAFAFGWTPCIGPVLGGILSAAAPTGSPTSGATLLFAYSLGMAVPFLLAGLFFTQVLGALRPVRAHWPIVNAVAATGVIIVGVLIASGRMTLITQQLSGVGFQGI